MTRHLLNYQFVSKRILSTSSRLYEGQYSYEANKIGLREVVGFGRNGHWTYLDSVTFPYPAVRFQEISPCYKALKEKEKGDWRALSMEDKKTLYRISFCQTFTEIEAPTGEWKTIVGSGLFLLGLGMALFTLQRALVIEPYPDSFSHENRVAMLKRMLAFRINPIEGLSSKWDYEKEKWK